MKNIYTYGGRPARRNLTIACLQANKAAGRKMTQVSAINGDEAGACAAMGIDLITIADHDIEDVRAAAPETFVTGSQTMVQYMTEDEALAAAIRCAEKGADAIFTPRGLKTIERLSGEGLAVQGHVGLVPRKSTLIGGLRTFGKTAEEAMQLFQDFKRLEDAGAVAAEVECVAVEALQEIGPRTSIVTHSIGAGSGGDIIFSFMEDICGDVENPPRHAKAWGDVLSIRKQMQAERGRALGGFRDDVTSGAFPDAAHTVPMTAGEQEKLQEALDKWSPTHQ
ncbi:3-methyl-2-oxobutanoate hydroxymethyltransferase [Halocynthiibacter styelae]|uniref:3-methyl-2-oxobutanoate hydroxymethyltransferase n=1 Tax=Halocynthiibacter styelae TaxID=2761955 RepID=A0A8J7LL26_9RHOB|nr:3-methyl-2-oxobutanoate hydroxymethyltransferase [Paenihalocynthiibacter styelae]MBI1493869.1 3-methyl-2-oxobutanoate hydroxymethyltransferase [Paenihalocynthiibacter styelae]